MIRMTASKDGKYLAVTASGKLTKEDYEQFLPKIEELIQKQGKIRVFFEMIDFKGWEAAALWEDIKFDMKHFSDIERLAFIGDKKWEKGMAMFCKPFTTAEIRYFDTEQASEATRWIM